MADEGGDVPEYDQSGAVLRIEHGDGSVTVSLDGRPLQEADNDTSPEQWFANLVEKIDATERSTIAEELLRGISDDLASRKEWEETRATGIKLLGLKVEAGKTPAAGEGDAPVEGMSTVRHPLLLEAVLRFQANARSELLPTDGPIKIRDDSTDGASNRDPISDALEKDLNHYLTDVATEYYPDTDRMLFKLGFGGDGFKKVYFCPLRNRPVSEAVDANDLIVNNNATDLKNARRVTHRLMMSPATVKRMQIVGVYRSLDLGLPRAPNENAVDQAEKAQQGISTQIANPLDQDREIYECYCELDIKGYEHKVNRKETGLPVPYRVTIDLSSREILAIVRNYNEDTKELPEPRVSFVKFPFVPGLGFYDLGLVHILGNTTNAITAAWRLMLDNGMFANFPGFLIAQSATRQRSNVIRVAPGTGAPVDTNSQAIRDAVMPLPYNTQQMPALMNLVGDIAQTGMRIGGTSEAQVGEGRADAPVGTTLAMIEQASRIENAVHKRLWTAQAEEFRLLIECFREHPESFWQRKNRSTVQWDQDTFLKALDDVNLVPQADPNTASHTQRIMKAMALGQAAQAAPQLFNLKEVQKAVLPALGWPNPDRFINANPMPDPKAVQAQSDGKAKEATSQAALITANARMIDAKSGLAAAGQPDQPPAAEPPDPLQVAKLHIQQQTLDQDRLEDRLEAENRERDRESKERIAAATFLSNLLKDPAGLQFLQAHGLITPEFIQELESNEPSIIGGRDGGESQ